MRPEPIALYGGEAMDSAGASKPDEEVASYQSSEAKQARLQSMLAALLDDPILADVPRKPSLADVDTLINLELGSAMRVTVVKLDNTLFGINNMALFEPRPHFCTNILPCVYPHLNSSYSCGDKDVAVLNTATLKDLKLAIRKKITEIEQGQMGHRHISW